MKIQVVGLGIKGELPFHLKLPFWFNVFCLAMIKYKSHGALVGQHETRQIFSLPGFSMPAHSYAFCLKMNRDSSAFLPFFFFFLFLPSMKTLKHESFLHFCGHSASDCPAPTVFSAPHKTQGEKSKDGFGVVLSKRVFFLLRKKYLCNNISWLSSMCEGTIWDRDE